MQYFYKSLYHLANRRGFGNKTRLKPQFVIEVVALRVRLDSHMVFGGVCVAHVFSFLCYGYFCVCLRLVFCVPNVVSFSGLYILDYPFGFP
jgi:hypothetical protein